MGVSILNIVIIALSFQSVVLCRATQQTSDAATELLPNSRLYAGRLERRVAVAPVARPILRPADDDPATSNPRQDGGRGGGGPDSSSHDAIRIPSSQAREERKMFTYDQLVQKGEDLYTKLTRAITNGAHDATMRPEGKVQDRNAGKYASAKDGYDITMGSKIRESTFIGNVDTLKHVFQHPVVKEALTRPEPDKGKKKERVYYQQVTIVSKKEQTIKGPINQCDYSPKAGVIISQQRFSDRDPWADTDPEKLPASELTWQQWERLCVEAGAQTGNLRVIFSADVKGEVARSTIHKAHVENNIPTDDWNRPGVFHMDPHNPAMNKAFFALLYTDNVRPNMWMLLDHHNHLGGKTIHRIVTFISPQGGHESEDEMYIAMILEE
ncbi:hypothetical protein K440DRAFT_664035 [Wilcoxina mikolae CBS 423.85]|nr:hypothetical protein K440DRAFT_664035 [Wilcoxina mikolae CBS 423.85]